MLGGRLGGVAVLRHPCMLCWVCVCYVCWWSVVLRVLVSLLIVLYIKRSECLFGRYGYRIRRYQAFALAGVARPHRLDSIMASRNSSLILVMHVVKIKSW